MKKLVAVFTASAVLVVAISYERYAFSETKVYTEEDLEQYKTDSYRIDTYPRGDEKYWEMMEKKQRMKEKQDKKALEQKEQSIVDKIIFEDSQIQYWLEEKEKEKNIKKRQRIDHHIKKHEGKKGEWIQKLNEVEGK